MVASLAERLATAADLATFDELLGEVLAAAPTERKALLAAFDVQLQARVLAELRTADHGRLLAVSAQLDAIVAHARCVPECAAFGNASPWEPLADLVGLALTRRDDAAHASLLAADNGDARRVAAWVATHCTEAGSVARREVEEQLGIETTRLSKLLKLLDEAGIIRRGKVGRSVHLALGTVGWSLVHAGKLTPTEVDKRTFNGRFAQRTGTPADTRRLAS